jgi:hypothetical protein
MTQIEMDFWEFVRKSRKFFSVEIIDIAQNRTPNYTRGKFIADALVKLNEAFTELEEARVMDHPKKYPLEAALTALPHERKGNPTFFTKVAIATHLIKTTEIKAIPVTDTEALNVLI